MTRPIVIVGASTRAAAQSARKAGFAPYCCDMFGDTDLQAIAERIVVATNCPKGIPEIVAEFPAAPWLYVGAIENSPQLVSEISATRELWGSSAEALAIVRDPLALRDLLTAHNIVAIDTQPSSEPPTARNAKEWLIKPIRSAAGRRVTWFDPARPIEFDEPHVFQRHVIGTPMSAVFVADGTHVTLCGATRQLVGESAFAAGEFGYCGSIGPVEIIRDLQEQLNAIGQAVTRDAGVRGLFGVDFIFDGWSAFVTEVNPRYTASVEVLEIATQRPLLSLHAAAFSELEGAMDAIARSAPALPSTQPQFGKAVLFADVDLRVGDLRTAAKSASLRIADIPAPGTLIRAGEPICSVFAESQHESKTEQLLAEHVAIIRTACDP